MDAAFTEVLTTVTDFHRGRMWRKEPVGPGLTLGKGCQAVIREEWGRGRRRDSERAERGVLVV